MQQHGIEPNVITCSALISALEKGKQPGRALKIFEQMQHHGIEHNGITYIALISALGKARTRAGLEDFRADAADGIEPNVITYAAHRRS